MPLTPVTWLNEFTVNLTTADTQARPRITQLANGNILVSWDSSNDTGVGIEFGTDIIGQIFTPLGERVGAEFQLNAGYFIDDERNADIAALPGGGFIVVYEDNDAATRSIRLQEFDASGTAVSTDEVVAEDSTPNAATSFSNPQVAVSSATSVLIVWQEAEVGGETRIVGKTYNPATDTYGSEISLINFPGTNNNPAVTVLNNGNYVIAAATVLTGGDQFISYRIVSSTGANVLGVAAIAATQADTYNDREPSVTALTGNGFVISWTSTDTIDTEVFMMVFNAAGTALTGAISVSDDGPFDNENESSVVALADGGFIVLFDDDDADELHGQRFDAAGNLVGSEFTVATGGSGIDEIDAVLLDDGRVAISFERANGEIGMEIIDTRDAPNNPAVYTPDSQIIGTIGDDVFNATANRNYGHDGNDTMTDDLFSTNSIFGGAGNDTITISSVNNTETADGGADIDTLIGINMTNGTQYNLQTGQMIEGANTQSILGFENVTGSIADEVFIGTAGTNIIDAGAGNDNLHGGLGADTLNGRAGFDLAWYSAAAAAVYARMDGVVAAGGEAVGDTFVDLEGFIGSNFGDTFVGRNVGPNTADYIDGLGGADTIYGLGGADRLLGSGGNDTLYGGAGADILTGGTENDKLYGGLDADVLNGGAGFDLAWYSQAAAGVYARMDGVVAAGGEAVGDTFIDVEGFIGSNFNDVFVGRNVGPNNADYIDGLGGSDTIYGLGGNDTLIGRDGNDTLFGGAGADVFSFITALNGTTNVDAIRDFVAGTDDIRLSQAIFAGIGATLDASEFQIGMADTATDRIIYNPGTGQLFYDSNGSTAGGVTLFATVTVGTVLAVSDFVMG